MPKQINTHVPGSDLVQRFALKGRFQPVLDEVIVPVAIVAEENPQAELPGFASTICTAAGAGNQNLALLSNPLGSNKILYVDSVAITTPAADECEVTVITAAGGNATQPRDAQSVANPAALVVRVAAAVAVIGPYIVTTEVAMRQIPLGLVIPQGKGVQIRQGTANSSMTVSWLFREVSVIAGIQT